MKLMFGKISGKSLFFEYVKLLSIYVDTGPDQTNLFFLIIETESIGGGGKKLTRILNGLNHNNSEC